ncbi:MAG: NYN domain-containing protein [Clostridia bacterium]|nr:NYN domain-containing protein [Clostridia bacterium]
MSEKYLIVDGYNIINSWPELSVLKKEDYSHARDKLVEILSDYQGFVRVNVILVFDGHNVKGNSGSRENMGGVEVVFTREGETADMFIERLIGELVPQYSVLVATSDWAEQRIVFGRGAYRISARELRILIQQTKKMGHDFMNSRQSFSLDSQIADETRLILEKWRREK